MPDVRTPYFALPPWVTDPFPTEKTERNEIVLNNRFRVKKAISFSNSGGVYLADDRERGKEVILKEARAHTAMDDRGNDAVKLLRKEHELLQLLRGTDVAPEPLDAFEAWENFFVAEEYLDGVDIREIMLTQSPLMQVRPSLEDSKEYYELCRRTLKAFAQAVDLLHRKGIVFGDLNAKNIRIDLATHAVRLIDFEGAFKPDSDQPTYLFTPGFKSVASIRKNTQGFEDDLFALASLLLAMAGVFGVLAYSVAQRTQEIGVRIALGATRGKILRMVLGQAMLTVVIGVILGLAGSFFLTRTMSSMLFEVSANDPLTVIAITVLLVFIALLASYIPARRATRVDPMVALRYE